MTPPPSKRAKGNGSGGRGPRHAPRPPRTPFVLLVLGLIIGGMCALLALNTASAANEVARHSLAARGEGLAARVADLQNQVAASAAPANLANAAGSLGMVPAGNPAFLVVGRDGQVRVMGSPGPVTGAPVYVAPRSSATHRSTAAQKPHKSHSPKPTKTVKATSTATATATGTKTSAAKTTSKSARPSPSHSKTPTPTPNTTLPGGTR